MINFLLIGSLVLGLISWVLPIIILIKYKRNKNYNWVIYSIASISTCSIAICFQVIYGNYITKIGDWSTLMDTIPTSTLLSIILLIGTLTLNGILVGMYYIKSN